MATRHKFLRQVWIEHINALMRPVWIDKTIEASGEHPDGPFAEAGRALNRLLELGASREDLCHIVRSVAYDTAFSIFYMLDDPGVDGNDVMGLEEELLDAAPRGHDGRRGTWPLADNTGYLDPEGRRFAFTFDPVPEPSFTGAIWHPRFTADPGVFDQLEVEDIVLQQRVDGTFQLFSFFGAASFPLRPRSVRRGSWTSPTATRTS